MPFSSTSREMKPITGGSSAGGAGPGREQVGIHAELGDDAGRAGVALGAQHPQRFAAAGDREGAATKHAALEPAKRGG